MGSFWCGVCVCTQLNVSLEPTSVGDSNQWQCQRGWACLLEPLAQLTSYTFTEQ